MAEVLQIGILTIQIDGSNRLPRLVIAEIYPIVIRRIVSGAVPAIAYSAVLAQFRIDAVAADERGVHLGIALLLVAAAVNLLEAAAFALCHNNLIDRLTAGRPVVVRIEKRIGLIHLIETVDHLPGLAIDIRRRGPRAGLDAVIRFDEIFDDRSCRIRGNLGRIGANRR